MAEFGEVRRWRRFWPRRRCVGHLPCGDEVWRLEVPYAAGDERVGRWLAKWLRRLEWRGGKCLGVECNGVRFGLPLALAEQVGREYPQVLAAARRAVCEEFVRRVAGRPGGVQGQDVGVQGLNAAWQAEVADGLFGAGARVAVQGGYAGRLAAQYWRSGVALPVVSVRKMWEVCDVVVVMPGAGGVPPKCAARAVYFGEVPVFVAGEFQGEYAFNMFPAGVAVALR